MSRLEAIDQAVVDSPSPTAAAITAAEKQALIERIVATPAFSKSERLVSLLLHVCRMEAAGRAKEISEQQIGEAVFGRSENYDPSIDGIVRSHASRLRLRLDQYFENEGIDEPIQLKIPRGAYVPFYERRLLAPKPEARQDTSTQEPVLHISAEMPSVAKQASAQPPAPRHSMKWAMWLTAIALAFFAGTVFNHTTLSSIRDRVGLSSPFDVFWRAVFVPGRETTLVVGDGGVNMFENMARRQVTAEEYSTRSWLNEPLAQTPPGYSWAPIGARTYTPWFAVDFAIRLARLSQVDDGQLKSMGAREITLDKLKNEQVIVIGGPEYNPWEELLGKDKNFHVVYNGLENSISIFNRHPGPGERPEYKWLQTDKVSHTGFSLVSLTKNLNGNGRMLCMEGTTAQGDAAAGEFVLDRSTFEPFLKKAMTPDGHIADFELVLQSDFVAGGSVNNRVIAYRIYP